MLNRETLHINSAVKGRFHKVHENYHLTTMDFGQIQPLLALEMLPGDKFSINADLFSRTAPLVKPTYGKFSFKTVSAFVPYFQLDEAFEDWVAGKTVYAGSSVPTTRFFKHIVFSQYLISIGTPVASTDAHDMVYKNSSGTLVYLRFDGFNRYRYKLLTCLGYTVPQNVDLQLTSGYMTGGYAQSRLSAMPLLAFLKVYNDYMSQSQRWNSSVLTGYLHDVRHGINSGLFDASTGEIYMNMLANMLAEVKLCYENDYFTSAWQTQTTPLNATENINLVDVGDGLSTSIVAQYSNRIELSNSTSMTRISQRGLDILRDFDNWVRRNNYSGSREVQQIYSRYGIKTDDYRSNYAHIIDTTSSPLQIGDVTAMSDASGELGDYAGKAIVSDGIKTSYESNDFGMLFIIGFVTVQPFMAYGFDRSILRVDPLDYYQPEFDGIGGDAISYAEVFENAINKSSSDTTLGNQTFGFTERYNSYRYFRDRITGDFRKFDNSDGMNTWHSGRLLSAIRANGTMIAQSSAFNTMPQSNSEYNRIFSVTSGTVDHFYMTCRFIIDATRNMLSSNDVLQLGDGNVTLPKNGNNIS